MFEVHRLREPDPLDRLLRGIGREDLTPSKLSPRYVYRKNSTLSTMIS